MGTRIALTLITCVIFSFVIPHYVFAQQGELQRPSLPQRYVTSNGTTPSIPSQNLSPVYTQPSTTYQSPSSMSRLPSANEIIRDYPDVGKNLCSVYSLFSRPMPSACSNITISSSATSLPSPPPIQSSIPAVTILSHSYWFDNSNEYIGPMLNIVGEALNQSPGIVSGVKVVATLYDSNNKIVGTDYSYLDISNNLYPNNKSPFKIVITDSDTPSPLSVASYSLAVDWS